MYAILLFPTFQDPLRWREDLDLRLPRHSRASAGAFAEASKILTEQKSFRKVLRKVPSLVYLMAKDCGL